MLTREEEERLRQRSFRICYWLGLVSLGLFTNILPTLFAFYNRIQPTGTQSAVIYGLIIAAFSIGRLIMCPILGLVADKGYVKPTLVICNLVAAGGNLIYALAVDAYMLLFGRLLVGVGASMTAALLAYIASVTTVQERTMYISRFWAISLIGVIFAPGCSLLFHFIPVTQQFNEFTGPGFLMLAVCSFSALLVLVLFVDVSKLPSKRFSYSNAYGQMDRNKAFCDVPKQSFLMYLVYFCMTYQNAAYEMMVAPYVAAWFQWTSLEASAIIMGTGCVLLVFNRIGACASRFCQDRTLVLVGCVLVLFGSVLLLQFPLAFGPRVGIFMTGTVLLISGWGLAWPIMPALFSKLMGPHPKKGAHMGLITADSSLSRIAAPLLIGIVQNGDFNPFIFVLIGLAGFMLLLVIVSFGYLKVIPPPMKRIPTLSISKDGVVPDIQAQLIAQPDNTDADESEKSPQL
eukprot:TRINITY_DN13492_c0_g1_i1.p1 TRINITY_DN13492_c0_g1~~TRINITY_DN13492_c0_g1_i1.p1  ORF type:complete len:459 (-),score=74.21 TRINITY_DN13492_c0_g1_i1:97-1473(-)